MTISQGGLSDPTDSTGTWAAVKVKPERKLALPVTLAAIKTEPRLAQSEIVRQSRLSVCELTEAEWKVLLEMAEG